MAVIVNREVDKLQPFLTTLLLAAPLLPLLQNLPRGNVVIGFQLLSSIAIQWYVAIRASVLSAIGTLTTARIFVFSFYYVSSGLAVEMSFLLNYHSGLDFYANMSQLNTSLMYSFVSLIILDFALPNSEIKLTSFQSKITPNIIFKLNILLTFILLALYIADTGISAIISSREAVSNNIAGGALASGNIAISGLYISATKIFPLITTAYALIFRKSFTHNIRFLIYLNLILLLLVNNPISTPRYQLAIFAVVIGYSLVPFEKNRNLKHLVSLVLFIVVIFPSLDFGRHSLKANKSFDISVTFKELALKDFDQVLMGAFTLSAVKENKQLFPIGKQILGETGAFIPRSFWKNKPLDSSISVARHFNLKNENLSIPLWAEGYMSFRLLGAITFPLILGLIFRKITKAVNPLNFFVFQSFLLGSVFIILRGTLMQFSGLLFAALLSITLMNRILVQR